MCRHHVLQGACLACLGLGLLLGYSLESWLLCCAGGAVLILLGVCQMKRR